MDAPIDLPVTESKAKVNTAGLCTVVVHTLTPLHWSWQNWLSIWDFCCSIIIYLIWKSDYPSRVAVPWKYVIMVCKRWTSKKGANLFRYGCVKKKIKNIPFFFLKLINTIVWMPQNFNYNEKCDNLLVLVIFFLLLVGGGVDLLLSL